VGVDTVKFCKWSALLMSAWHIISIATHADDRVDSDWDVGTQAYYSSGDYGEDEKTEIFYLPVIIRLHDDRWKYALTIPYLQVKSPGSSTIIDGSPGFISGDDAERRVTRSGLGDIALKATYDAVAQKDYLPWISVYGRLKLATADEDKGLGTGKTDLGFGVEMVRTLKNHYVIFFETGYTFIGEPSGKDFSDRKMYSIGLGRQITDELLVAAFYEWRSSIVKGNTDPQELSFMLTCRMTKKLRSFAMLDLGLNDGAADYGIAGGFTYRL